MADKQQWVRLPGPGQLRGEGEWVKFIGPESEWQALQESGYLPTHEGERPND